jgi:hypothetical protein
MNKKYFELIDDLDRKGRWFLNGISDSNRQEFDSRDFTYGRPLEVHPRLRISLYNEERFVEVDPPLCVSLRREGNPLDFTYADFDMPVASLQVAKILAKIAGTDIQTIPARIEARGEEYAIINVASIASCINPNRSEITWWSEADERPDKIGKARMVTKLVIDPKKVSRFHIFRPEEWDVVIIVSNVIKRALEEAQITGVTFRPV